MRASPATPSAHAPPVLDVHVRPVGSQDPFAFLAAARGEPRAFYRGRHRTVAGVGVAHVVRADDPATLRAMWTRGRPRLRLQYAAGVPPAVRLPWIGGFPFDDGAPATLWLPQRGLVLGAGGDFSFTVDASSAPRLALRAPSPSEEWRPEPSFEPWALQVRAALQGIREGRAEKVVLARRLIAEGAPDLVALLRRLAALTPESALFLLELQAGDAWFGATPELLVSKSGDRVRTAAVAGSRPRGRNEAEDEALGRSLLTSSKDAWEHELVARFVREALQRSGCPWRATSERRLLKLPNVQHLASEFEAEDTGPHGVLAWAERLHPTPAVAGAPREAARVFVRELEQRARAWYTGAVGWVDDSGDGEFSVAIRTGHAHDGRVELWAGCGLVNGSDPVEEWEESRLKMELLQGALAGSP